tara:strand:- start:31 stop:780 length:750 start_codon:yes stop_codon:yes gene_type:complete
VGIQGGNFEKPLMTFEESLEFILPEDPFKNPGGMQRKDPLDFLKDYFKDTGITEQNQEVMGSKEQVFPRYANPADGTLTFGGPEAEGPGHVLRDGSPDPRMRGPLFPGNIENIDFEFQRKLKKMLDEMYKNREQRYPYRMNQAEPTGDQIARVDPTDKLLLDSLRKGEIGDPNSPRIRKAIIDLERKIYNEGRASSMEGALMAADPSFAIPREVSPQEVNQINRRVISDYEKKKEMLRRGFLAPLLRGV